jgi:alkanesulfonate monooxygenase SsuD/methylene tetrahydromethanopterin reductase-like flavin-dependent oxidoreductase (luciferase family)
MEKDMEFDIYQVNNVPEDRSDHEILQENMELMLRAEELGFSTVWFAEHFFNSHGRPAHVVQAAYLAAKTKKIRIGSAVVVLPYHNPIEVAQDWATLDILSGGRVELGIGAGFFKLEFDGLNIPFDETRGRFDEAKEILLKAWTEESFSYNGKYYKFPQSISVVPKPVQKPHPRLWVPAVSPGTSKKLAQQRINPILGGVFLTRSELVDQFAVWHNALKEYNLVPGDIQSASVEMIYVAETNDAARREIEKPLKWMINNFAHVMTPPAGGWPESYKFYEEYYRFFRSLDFDRAVDELTAVGDPDKVAARLRVHLEEGKVDRVLCWFNFGAVPHKLAMHSMELFSKHVMPQFKKVVAQV